MCWIQKIYWHCQLSSEKISSSELQTAVNTALAQAKESGEFDGYTPVRYVDYWTEADKQQMISDTIAALPDASEVNY